MSSKFGNLGLETKLTLFQGVYIARNMIFLGCYGVEWSLKTLFCPEIDKNCFLRQAITYMFGTFANFIQFLQPQV